MKKMAGIFIQGIALGSILGLCLAEGLALIFRVTHGTTVGHTTLYFLVVGGLMGFLGGWCLALQMVLNHLLSLLFFQISQLVPLTGSVIGEEWVSRMETFFREVLRPMPKLFGRLVNYFLVTRFRDYGRVNRSIEKAKKQQRLQAYSPEWTARVVLHYFLEPLWAFFYTAYVILFGVTCVLWSIPFLG